MSDGTRMPLAEAQALATRLGALLAPACDRVLIAGSIRREVPTVGDIELLVLPTLADQADLFGETTATRNLLEERCADLLDAGTLGQRRDKNGVPRWGPRYKAAVFANVAVDLFAVLPPAQWGVLSLIRTGPGAWSKQLVTPQRLGGWLPNWAHVRDGAIWHTDGSMLVTPEEADVWALLGRDPIAPAARQAPVAAV